MHTNQCIWYNGTLQEMCDFDVFLSILGTKTLKAMETSLYGKTKQHDQKRAF